MRILRFLRRLFSPRSTAEIPGEKQQTKKKWARPGHVVCPLGHTVLKIPRGVRIWFMRGPIRIKCWCGKWVDIRGVKSAPQPRKSKDYLNRDGGVVCIPPATAEPEEVSTA